MRKEKKIIKMGIETFLAPKWCLIQGYRQRFIPEGGKKDCVIHHAMFQGHGSTWHIAASRQEPRCGDKRACFPPTPFFLLLFNGSCSSGSRLRLAWRQQVSQEAHPARGKGKKTNNNLHRCLKSLPSDGIIRREEVLASSNHLTAWTFLLIIYLFKIGLV